MRLALLGLVASVALAAASAATPATPATKLTITTRLEGGQSPQTYTLTCGPAAVRGLPPGTLRASDACRGVALAGARLYRQRLSRHIPSCNYIAAPRRAVIVGHRLGRKVRATVEVGGCERLLVPLRVLGRFVVWSER